MDIEQLSADDIERYYGQGRLGKRDVVRWVRLSAKLSGRIYERIYEPTYRSGAVHDRLWLRRREDVEAKLYAKRTGYWSLESGVRGD